MGDFTIVDGITIAFSVIAAIFSVHTYRCTLVRDRRRDTLDAYNRLQEQALDVLMKYKISEIKEIAENSRKAEYIDRFTEISKLVARIEHFSAGVKLEIYDEKVVFELARGFLNGKIKNRIEPVIAVKNRNSDDYYANTHWLLNCMDEEEESRKNK